MTRTLGATQSGLSTSLISLLLFGFLLCKIPHLQAREGDACTLKENWAGVCMASSKCEPRVQKYIQSGRLTDNDVPSCGLGLREEIVCCPAVECCPDEMRLEATTARIIQATPANRVDVSTPEERPAVRACRIIQDRKGSEGLVKHIIGGIAVDPGIYPHMAAIAFSTFGSFTYRCGGSLISKRHVLTAAHCVLDLPSHVRLGSVDIDRVSKHYQDIAILPDKIKVHPEYVSTSKYYDIAVLELAEEAKLSYFIYPACLETNTVDPPTNSQLYVAGWGVMNQSNRSTSKILLRAPLNIVPVLQCNESYAEQPGSKSYLQSGVIDSLLCAADKKNGTADACQGDSGGPLVFEREKDNKVYSILGIINSGFGCATKTPGLYTRVASFLNFIEDVVWPNNVV